MMRWSRARPTVCVSRLAQTSAPPCQSAKIIMYAIRNNAEVPNLQSVAPNTPKLHAQRNGGRDVGYGGRKGGREDGGSQMWW